MSDLITRLRALGIELGEDVCDYELRAQESNLIPRLVSDAALAELVTALEEAHKEVKAYQTGFDGDVEAQTARAERAEAEALRVEKAAARISEEMERVEDKLARAETAFGILSYQHYDDAAEAWRKAGELGGGGE